MSVKPLIFLNEKVLIFVAIAGQLAYIKREKNMQYCNKSKTESKEGVSMDDKTEFVRMATTQCLKYMSVNEANKVEQILSVLLTKYSLKKETYALSTETVTPNQKLVNTFLAIKKISGLTDKSLKAYNNEIQMMLKAINKPIADIKVNDIRAYLAFVAVLHIFFALDIGELTCNRYKNQHFFVQKNLFYNAYNVVRVFF